MTTIYHLWSRSRSPAHEAEQWLREVAPALGLCRGCAAFRTDRAIDVPLHAPLDGSALNFFWSTRVGIASIELLDAIGREIVFKSLRLGRVLDTSGKPLSDVRTFRAVNSVRIRGGPHSTIRRCEVCNCILYAPVRSHHLVGDASNFIGLFGTDRGGELIADQSIVEHIERPTFQESGHFHDPRVQSAARRLSEQSGGDAGLVKKVCVISYQVVLICSARVSRKFRHERDLVPNHRSSATYGRNGLQIRMIQTK